MEMTEEERLLALYSRKIDESYYPGHEQAKGVYSTQHFDAIYPLDPRTNLPMSDTAKLTDPTVTEAEREQIMSRLSAMDGGYLPKDLSDEEIYELVPPRYFTYDQVDVQAWRDYLSREIIPDMDFRAREALALSESDPADEKPESKDTND